jgi:hypothetical protein
VILPGSSAWGFAEILLPDDDLESAVRVGTFRYDSARRGARSTLPIGDLGSRSTAYTGRSRSRGSTAPRGRSPTRWISARRIQTSEGRRSARRGTGDGYLPFRPRRRDRLERAFSLVTLLETRGLCRAVGWIYGFDAAVPRYLRPADANGPAFYAVPQDGLTDPAWLPIIREGEAW